MLDLRRESIISVLCCQATALIVNVLILCWYPDSCLTWFTLGVDIGAAIFFVLWFFVDDDETAAAKKAKKAQLKRK